MQKIKNTIASSVIFALVVAFALWVLVRIIYSKEISIIYDNVENSYPIYFNGGVALLCSIFSIWSIKVVVSEKYEGAWEIYRVFLFMAGTVIWGYGFIEALSEAA